VRGEASGTQVALLYDVQPIGKSFRIIATSTPSKGEDHAMLRYLGLGRGDEAGAKQIAAPNSINHQHHPSGRRAFWGSPPRADFK
jgi:hypothetical protein